MLSPWHIGDRFNIRLRIWFRAMKSELTGFVETLLGHLRDGDRVAVLTEEQELTPNEAANILGVSRPLVVHRMDIGDLPFREIFRSRAISRNERQSTK